jgi:uncharacterized Zn-finger protein
MNTQEIIEADQRKVSCEGLKSGFGHPKVYLEIKEDKVECPYCSKIFILKKAKK